MIRRLLLLAVVLSVAAGGAFVWYLRDDSPSRPELSKPKATSSTQGTGPAAGGDVPARSPDGEWAVVSGESSFMGYRVQETFASDTVHKTAVGRTSSFDATMTVKAGLVTKANVRVDVDKIVSDRSLRDDAMRTRGLETNTFPEATFTLTEPVALPAGIKAGQEVKVSPTGDLMLHGTTKRIRIALDARWDTSTIEVAGTAPILFSDFSITTPSNAFVSVEDHGELELHLTFSRSEAVSD